MACFRTVTDSNTVHAISESTRAETARPRSSRPLTRSYASVTLACAALMQVGFGFESLRVRVWDRVRDVEVWRFGVWGLGVGGVRVDGSESRVKSKASRTEGYLWTLPP
eukprot:2752790-Rhodomonas_salina.2